VNLKELRAEIIKDNDDSLSNSDITTWINRALDDLTLVARYKRKTSIPIVNGVSDYTMPPDFLDTKLVTINGSTNLDRLPLSDFTSTGYKVLGNVLSIQNTPKTSGTIDLIYLATLPHLSSDNDVPMIPANFHDLLVLYTVGKAKFVDEVTDLQRIALKEYQQRKQDLSVFMAKLERPKMVRDVYGW
jgi:hypothetical protein